MTKLKYIASQIKVTDDPNAKYRSIEEKILSSGYRVETHRIVTEDRYILTAFRIPGKIGEAITEKKKPCTLTHALIDDSYSWLMLNDTNNIAIQLAEQK